MKIGVFGLGFMGSTHLQAWRKTPRAELAAVVCDIPKRLEGDLSDVQGNIGGPGERMDFSRLARYSDPYIALSNPGDRGGGYLPAYGPACAGGARGAQGR